MRRSDGNEELHTSVLRTVHPKRNSMQETLAMSLAPLGCGEVHLSERPRVPLDVGGLSDRRVT